MPQPSISKQEFAERRQRALAMAEERGLSGLVVWSRNATTVDWYGDVLYLANHHTPFPQQADNPPLWSGRGHSVLVMPVGAEPVLVVDRRNTARISSRLRMFELGSTSRRWSPGPR